MATVLVPPSRVDDVLFDVSHYFITKDVVEHGHNCIEIACLVAGVAVQSLNGVKRNIYPGCVTIMHPGCAHAILSPKKCELYNVSCAPDLLRVMGVNLLFLKGREELFHSKGNSLSLNLSGLLFMDVQNLLRHMFSIHQDKSAKDRHVQLRSLFSMFLLLLAQAWEPKTEKADSRLSMTLEYMEAHCSEKLPLEYLARHASMSKNQFLRKFHEEFGNSPLQYLLDLRLRRAAGLLEDSQLTVDQIADAMGFYNSSHFIKLYKRKFGISAGRQRRIKRQGNA